MARKLNNLGAAEAKARVVELIGHGATVREAMASVGRQPKTMETWRSGDKEFAAAVDAARERHGSIKSQGKDPGLFDLGFAEWRRRFLGTETYPHQQMWIDVLEGREPHVFHDSITYKPGNDNYVLINTPPAHAKSTTITIHYSVYRLCMRPSTRIIVISKTQEMAAKFLFAIRQILTDPYYAELQAAYAPEGGWRPERGEGRWSNNLIYLAGRNADAADKAAKDPSVTAVGIGGQVYGARADLILLDDCVDDTNHSAFEKQFDWLTRTVMSRTNGKTLVVGTRIAPNDLYSHLLNDDTYMDGQSPWTYLAQPAVLEFADDPKDWVTLWPRSTQPADELASEPPDEDGLFRAQDGPRLSHIRSRLSAGMWALVYQQQQVSEDMTFHPTCVWASVDKRRVPGPLIAGALGHTDHGMEGMRTVLAIDPAAAGEAALLAYAVNRADSHRWVLDAWKKVDSSPTWYLQMLEELHPTYHFDEVMIEAQGYSNWAIHDPGLVAYCRDHGIRLKSSYTGKNKQDPDFGVPSMAPLFGTLTRADGPGQKTVHRGDNVIHLPDPRRSKGVKALIDELMVWVPSKKAKNLTQDCVMALWLGEQVAREWITGTGKEQQMFLENKYLSRGAARRRMVLPAGAYGATSW